MKFCNNCGNKLEEQVKFCTECGVERGTLTKEKRAEYNSNNPPVDDESIFTYNGVDVDLKELGVRYGKNKISAIKELRERTGLSLSDAKEIIDKSYSGVTYISKNEIVTKNDNKGCLSIFLWILFFPIMGINSIIKNNRMTNLFKVISITGITLIGLPYLFGILSIMITSLPFTILAVISVFIYMNKKKEEAKRVENMKHKEEMRRIEIERQDKIINKTLDIVFDNTEMNIRLKEFILQHTKKYDDSEIDYDEYSNTLDMFLIYLNKKVNSEIKIPKKEDNEEIISYWKENGIINIDKEMISSFIENRKLNIYSDDIKNIINISDYEILEDVIKEYIDTFGEKGLKSLNIKILSDALDEDYEEIFNLVNKEYTKVKEEYEMRKLEGHLFKSGANHKDLKYIDSLSGFEFEDFLDELFIGFGYTSKELPYSNDYGADLIITKGLKEIVIQAKNYSGSVGNKAVQEVIAAKDYYKSDIAMVITNAYYTQNAIKTAQASGIFLVDRDGLERIINEGSIYFNSLVS